MNENCIRYCIIIEIGSIRCGNNPRHQRAVHFILTVLFVSVFWTFIDYFVVVKNTLLNCVMRMMPEYFENHNV